MANKPRKRTKYRREYKIEAVRLSSEGIRTISDVAADLGISLDSLYRWRREFAKVGVSAFPGNGKISSEDEKIRRLERDLKRVTEELAVAETLLLR